jgi:hypothetical protein
MISLTSRDGQFSTHLFENERVCTEHSGAKSCTFSDTMEDAWKMPFKALGQANPKEENKDTTCKKSTPIANADRLTP